MDKQLTTEGIRFRRQQTRRVLKLEPVSKDQVCLSPGEEKKDGQGRLHRAEAELDRERAGKGDLHRNRTT